MTRPTVLMLNALKVAARAEGLRRTHQPDMPGRAPWPCSPNTIRALERRGLVEHRRAHNRRAWPVDVWVATEAGRDALKPAARAVRDGHNSMAALGAATGRVMVYGVWRDQRFPEPEKVPSPGAGWQVSSRNAHAGAQDRRLRAQKAKAA